MCNKHSCQNDHLPSAREGMSPSGHGPTLLGWPHGGLCSLCDWLFPLGSAAYTTCCLAWPERAKYFEPGSQLSLWSNCSLATDHLCDLEKVSWTCCESLHRDAMRTKQKRWQPGSRPYKGAWDLRLPCICSSFGCWTDPTS